MWDPTVINLLAHQILNCVCTALDDTALLVDGQPGCPCRACVVAGTPLLSICDPGCSDEDQQGQLYVSVVRTFWTTNFPVPDQSPINCKPGTLAVELLITLVRCAALMDDKGNPPTCEQLAAVAAIVNTDMYTVMSAVMCCVPEDPLRPRKARRVAIIEQRAKGPDGSVVGFDMRVIVDLNDACGCPAEVS